MSVGFKSPKVLDKLHSDFLMETSSKHAKKAPRPHNPDARDANETDVCEYESDEESVDRDGLKTYKTDITKIHRHMMHIINGLSKIVIDRDKRMEYLVTTLASMDVLTKQTQEDVEDILTKLKTVLPGNLPLAVQVKQLVSENAEDAPMSLNRSSSANHSHDWARSSDLFNTMPSCDSATPPCDFEAFGGVNGNRLIDSDVFDINQMINTTHSFESPTSSQHTNKRSVSLAPVNGRGHITADSAHFLSSSSAISSRKTSEYDFKTLHTQSKIRALFAQQRGSSRTLTAKDTSDSSAAAHLRPNRTSLSVGGHENRHDVTTTLFSNATHGAGVDSNAQANTLTSTDVLKPVTLSKFKSTWNIAHDTRVNQNIAETSTVSTATITTAAANAKNPNLSVSCHTPSSQFTVVAALPPPVTIVNPPEIVNYPTASPMSSFETMHSAHQFANASYATAQPSTTTSMQTFPINTDAANYRNINGVAFGGAHAPGYSFNHVTPMQPVNPNYTITAQAIEEFKKKTASSNGYSGFTYHRALPPETREVNATPRQNNAANNIFEAIVKLNRS